MDSYREWAIEISLMSKAKVLMEESLGCASIGVKKREHIVLCMQTKSARANAPHANMCHLRTSGTRRFCKETGKQRVQVWFCPSFFFFFIPPSCAMRKEVV